MREPIVYVVTEDRSRDISDALRFGNIRGVFPPNSNSAIDVRHDVETAENNLAGFMPHDWLLLMGDPVLMGICCTIVARNLKGKIPVLKWSRLERKYVPHLVQIGELDD